MRKIGQILTEISEDLSKVAFVPNPEVMQRLQQAQAGPPGGEAPAGDPNSQGGEAPSGAGGVDPAQLQQIISQLPPQVQQQVMQLPPEQQMEILSQYGLIPPAGGGSPQGQGSQGSQQQEQVVSAGPPTDLENSTVTLTVKELLDLVSGGKATQSKLKTKAMEQMHGTKLQLMQQKAQSDQQRQEAKLQQQQQQDAQKQQEMGMAGQGGMMSGGGLY